MILQGFSNQVNFNITNHIVTTIWIKLNITYSIHMEKLLTEIQESLI